MQGLGFGIALVGAGWAGGAGRGWVGGGGAHDLAQAVVEADVEHVAHSGPQEVLHPYPLLDLDVLSKLLLAKRV